MRQHKVFTYMIKRVAKAVPRELIESELRPEYVMRPTNHGGNTIYVIDAQSCPNIMREIGRLREWGFRDAGGGTGNDVDIDEDDLAVDGYKQLIVWDPDAREILGGYRFIVATSPKQKHLSTEHYFRFSDKFRNDYLPYTIELGRSFVHPEYQTRKYRAKGIYALDNLWDGLGTLTMIYPEAKYFFGKVTMYTQYDTKARNTLMYFLHKYFPDNEKLVDPISPIPIEYDIPRMEEIFNSGDYKTDYKALVKELRDRGEFIPPLINSYMSLSPSMKVFDTVTNPDFGDVEETGILITVDDIYPSKMERHTQGMEGLIAKLRYRFALATSPENAAVRAKNRAKAEEVKKAVKAKGVERKAARAEKKATKVAAKAEKKVAKAVKKVAKSKEPNQQE